MLLVWHLEAGDDKYEPNDQSFITIIVTSREKIQQSPETLYGANNDVQKVPQKGVFDRLDLANISRNLARVPRNQNITKNYVSLQAINSYEISMGTLDLYFVRTKHPIRIWDDESTCTLFDFETYV